tara:strand:+ start:312 stop:605 length:294 start_codon:yes stop_codon:yes gene_type:complete
VQQHRIDWLTGAVEQRQRHVDVIASSGLIAKQGQDKGAVPMQIGLIWRLDDGLIAAFDHQFQVIHLEVPQATGHQWCGGINRLRWLFCLASTKQHSS